jgi:hypothetical protein
VYAKTKITPNKTKAMWIKPHIYCIEQDSKLSYFYRVRIRDETGDYITKKITCDNNGNPFQTPEEAENHRSNFISTIKKYVATHSNPSTIKEIFEDYIQKRGSALLGNRKLIDVSKAELNSLLTTMMFKENYKYKTVLNVLITMRNIWRYSAELGIISSSYFMDFFCDPVISVKMPIKQSSTSNKEVDIYTTQEQSEL